jgi:hypothetical protein
MCKSEFSDQCSGSMTFLCGSGSTSGTLFFNCRYCGAGVDPAEVGPGAGHRPHAGAHHHHRHQLLRSPGGWFQKHPLNFASKFVNNRGRALQFMGGNIPSVLYFDECVSYLSLYALSNDLYFKIFFKLMNCLNK